MSFELPEELKDNAYEKILAGMLSEVADKYDKTEGSFVFDMIAPAALEADELINLWLALGIKTNFYMYAGGKWLDLHAGNCGLERRAATSSWGELTIETSKAVRFPAGFIFAVPSEGEIAAIEFETVKEAVINGSGQLEIQSVEAGLIGNVPAGSVSIMKNPVKGVLSIEQTAALTGGTIAEDDESLRGRIADFYAGRGSSYVGNAGDYKRWAQEVDGVGAVKVIPCYAGANTVKLVLADGAGASANAKICAAVEKYIFGSSHKDTERLAPVGVVAYEVVGFTEKAINISAQVKLKEEYKIATVKANLVTKLIEKFKELATEEFEFGSLKFIDVQDCFYHTEGIADFKEVKVDGATEAVEFGDAEMPALGEITLTTY